MNTYYPTWLNASLFVIAAVTAYLGTQTSVSLTGWPALAIGAVEVAVAALLAFQRTTTNTVRRLQGRPTIS